MKSLYGWPSGVLGDRERPGESGEVLERMYGQFAHVTDIASEYLPQMRSSLRARRRTVVVLNTVRAVRMV